MAKSVSVLVGDRCGPVAKLFLSAQRRGKWTGGELGAGGWEIGLLRDRRLF